jgi:hypothetical protein
MRPKVCPPDRHEVEEQMDCKACANCCRETRVNISRKDLEALARHLGMPPEQVIKKYSRGRIVQQHSRPPHRVIFVIRAADPTSLLAPS